MFGVRRWVAIANRHQVDIRILQPFANVRPALSINSDHSYTQLVVRPYLGRWAANLPRRAKCFATPAGQSNGGGGRGLLDKVTS